MDSVFSKTLKAIAVSIFVFGILFSVGFNFSLYSKIGHPFISFMSVSDLFVPVFALSFVVAMVAPFASAIYYFFYNDEIAENISEKIDSLMRFRYSIIIIFIVSFSFLFVDYFKKTQLGQWFFLTILIIIFIWFSFDIVKEYRFSEEINYHPFFICGISILNAGLIAGVIYFGWGAGRICNVVMKKGEFIEISIFRHDDKRLIGFMGDRLILLNTDSIDQVRCGSFKSR
jgi:hypothetical protein